MMYDVYDVSAMWTISGKMRFFNSILLTSAFLAFVVSDRCEDDPGPFSKTSRFDYERVTGLDGRKLFEKKNGEFERVEGSSTNGGDCFLSWDTVGGQIRHARASRRNRWIGHYIEVNGNVEMESTSPGVYVNSPDATYSVASFHLHREASGEIRCPEPTEDDCFFFDGDECKQYSREFQTKLRDCQEKKAHLEKYPYMCDYSSQVTLFPSNDASMMRELDAREFQERRRQSETCNCDMFTDCAINANFMRCGWSEFVTMHSRTTRNREFCMTRVCSFYMDGAGGLVSSLRSNVGDLDHEACYDIWTQGTKKPNWYFTVSTVAVSPSVLHKNVPTSVPFPSSTIPSRSDVLPSAENYRCSWTQISFFEFSPRDCPQGNVLSPDSDLSDTTSREMSGSEMMRARKRRSVAWMERERNGRAALRFQHRDSSRGLGRN